MNDFSELDAQNEDSVWAQMSIEEQAEYEDYLNEMARLAEVTQN